jgi:DNA primase
VRFPPSLLDEIRTRLPVSAVVGKRVRLKKAGREWKGLSPFNAEKSPSFFVNDQKGFYHCFSSGKHGDIFTFVQETEGLSFPEAVEKLAGEAGVTLPTVSHEVEVQERRRRSLHDVMEIATEFFERELRGRRGAKARDYLSGRGLTLETQQMFRMGYSPAERFALRDHLAEKGVSADAMEATGLLVGGEDVAVPFDRFRDRVMFPICDAKGRVIAFGGRALSADVPAKYLNSPETTLFEKGRVLYNAHRARKAAHERGTVVAVEGYVDVIAMTAAGFPNAVAPLGTALTAEQLALLWRMADEPILCFDGDSAGRRAAYRALDVALPAIPEGKSLRVALLPEGQDPDDLVRSGGAQALDRALSNAKPLIDILWTRELEAGPLDTPERRAALERRLREALGLIRDETLRRYYREAIEERLASLSPRARPGREDYAARRSGPGGREPYRRRDGGRGGASGSAGLQASPALTRNALFSGGPSVSPREAAILSAFITHPALLNRAAELLADLEFSSGAADRIRSVLLDCAADWEMLDPELVKSRIERAGLGESTAQLLARVRGRDRWAMDLHVDPIRLEDALRQAIILHRKARTLHRELRTAERALAEDDSETNFAWLCELQGQLSSLEGAEAEMDDSAGGRNGL